ncbi:GNAT family N-acetyltransferase [Faecalibacter sp. LW9]|uniref:GNAT family N-acetyltransferase n=1 Tax=Faecalibacter sp. LW9 TaxID=3103144 RepID=UPI002AFEF2D7|nr:GNAT family N-acetyltransferase [Faecalibacter sp. LW9]
MIITAHLQHLDELTLLFDAYRQFYDKPSDIDAAKSFLTDRMENQESVIYCSVNEENQITGFVQLYPLFSSTRLKRFWILNDLFVLPQFRGNGYSKALIEEAKNLCKQTNACGMLLETSKENQIGNQLYPETGFIRRDDANFYEWEIQ